MRQRRNGRLGLAAALAACAWALLAAGGAQAATVTVGSVLPPGATPTEFGSVQTAFNTALPEHGASLTSPVTGAIVRWRVQAAEGGPFFLRVLRPTGAGAYAAVGTSGAATPSGTGVQTFTANLPIHSGDMIGLDPTNATDKVGTIAVAGANFAFIFPAIVEGATVAPSKAEAGKEIELSAEVQPAPAVTAVSPRSGSVAGGAKVTITGTNLGGASAVKFGNLPATSFTVNSETQITATAPASKTTGPVDVTATTLAGTSEAGGSDRFSYSGCVVPKLKGKKLSAAKNALFSSGCKLGKVTRKKGKQKGGKVVAQSPRPGKVLVPNSKVNLTLGKVGKK